MVSTVFLLFLWSDGLGAKSFAAGCSSLTAPHRGSVACFRGKETVGCVPEPSVNSVAEFSCMEFYRLSVEEWKRARCLSNGSWSSPVPKCVADCGRRTGFVGLILGGAFALPDAFPWHAALYHSIDGNYEYWCGGTLVSETAVITAAHCVWNVPPRKLILAFGKFHREYSFVEKNIQKVKAKRIQVLDSYQDVAGNYNGDIALIFLQRPVSFSRYSAPICLDWDQRLMDRQLVERASGVVLGWGLTENDTFSDRLRVTKLPVVPDGKCIAAQERDFKKFVTYTSFCAGFGNGSGVCNGDSGGGLAFFDADSGRWYLQGLVSVSPRRKGTPYCDARFYTVFTKVSIFSRWLKQEMETEESPWRKWPRGKGSSVGKKTLVFPHTRNMLQLARLSESPSE